jgi:hypothetical protein
MSVIALQSCIVVAEYGPPGRDGKAFFGIDYDFNPPYSYWDNNPNMPSAPFFGEYYRSNAGRYNFEYFVNQTDYWYGTYEIFIHRGQAGQPMGEPGADGMDTYLMLICNDEGFYFEDQAGIWCDIRLENGIQHIEMNNGEQHFIITMQKTSIKDRKPEGIPKFQK